MKDRENHLTKKKVKERGWTDFLISKYLGEPDIIKNSGYYQGGGKIYLYSIDRVISCEQLDEFSQDKEISGRRSRAALNGASTKTKKLINLIENLEIIIPDLDPDDLLARAIASYNERSSCGLATISSEKAFLDRITVNYIRHELTKYEDVLESSVGKVGRLEAADTIRDMIYNKISDKYPHLQDECDRQYNDKRMNAMYYSSIK
jgi:hypothetical protein